MARRYLGLFGPDDARAAESRAMALEQQRQQRAAEASARINRLFGMASENELNLGLSDADFLHLSPEDRAALGSNGRGLNQLNAHRRQGFYDTLAGDVRNLFMPKLQGQRRDASSNLAFNLARAGLSGGSVDVSKNNEIGRRYDEGVLDIANRGIAAGSRARGNDERNRLDILTRIQNGLDVGAAVQTANAGLQDSLDSARSDATARSLGDFFETFADAQQQRRIGDLYDEAYRRRRPGTSASGSGYSGVINTGVGY